MKRSNKALHDYGAKERRSQNRDVGMRNDEREIHRY